MYSLSVGTAFGLKTILSDEYCQPGFLFWLLVCTEYLSILSLSVSVTLNLKWSFVDSLYVGLAFIGMQAATAFGWSFQSVLISSCC